MCSSVWDLLTGPASVLSLLSGICPHSPLELLGSLRWSLLSQRWPGSLGRESHSPHQPPARPGPCPRSGYIHSSRPSQLKGGEKLFKMNSTDGMLPALNCRILFPCCCVSPVSCRFVCKLSKRPVFHRVWRPLPRAPSQQGPPDCVPMPPCWASLPTLACRACRANRCTHMPTHSTASCVWPGASMTSSPSPTANLRLCLFAEVEGEAA